jgi:hypothetical protein
VKLRLAFHSVLVTLLLALCPAALASNTWYVDGVHGSDNNNCKSRQTACKTIGHAISLAHSGDSIMVAAATYTENLGLYLSLKIVGSSAKTTIIDGGAKGTVITIGHSNVTISKLTIRNGLGGSGGGIYNSGMLTIANSTVSGNTANGRRDAFGGGIANFGTLTIANSTISGNTASGVCNPLRGGICVGGGIFNGGTLMITNSTITGNNAGNYGGGIANGNVTTINSSTISGNSVPAQTEGGGISGGAIIRNSIVADNSGGNCNSTITSKGYNLSSDGTCDFDNTGDLNNTDPKLGTFGNNGGPTQTIPLLSGSPAIDAGNPNGCTDSQGHLLKTDQRGKTRPNREDKNGCDMGAFERQKD